MTDSKIPSRASKAILAIHQKISESAKIDEWQTEKCIYSNTGLILKVVILFIFVNIGHEWKFCGFAFPNPTIAPDVQSPCRIVARVLPFYVHEKVRSMLGSRKHCYR